MSADREDGPASVDAKGNVVTLRHERDDLFATTGFNFDDMGEVKASGSRRKIRCDEN